MEKVDLKRDGYVDLEYVNFMIIFNIKVLLQFFIFLILEVLLYVLNFIVLIFYFFFEFLNSVVVCFEFQRVYDSVL